MIIALAIAIPIMIYAFMIGMSSMLAKLVLDRREWLSDRGSYGWSSRFTAIVWLGALWPLGFPLIFGLVIGHWFTDFETRAKAKERRAQLAHERKISEENASRRTHEAALAVLKAEGVNV